MGCGLRVGRMPTVKAASWLGLGWGIGIGGGGFGPGGRVTFEEGGGVLAEWQSWRSGGEREW